MSGKILRVTNYYGDYISGKVYHDELEKNTVYVDCLRIGSSRIDINKISTISELESLKVSIDELINLHKEVCEVEEMIGLKQ